MATDRMARIEARRQRAGGWALTRLPGNLWRRLTVCTAVGHEWTSPVRRGIRWDSERFAAEGVAYAERYVARTCVRCGAREAGA